MIQGGGVLNLEPDRIHTTFEQTSDPRETFQRIQESSALAKSNRLPWILFFATVITTIIAGSLQQGLNPLASVSNFLYGIPFSFTLLLILGVHELGHYAMCKIHGVPSTVPYFIPLPVPSILGTMGAFIKIKGRIPNRRALLDIGMAGPLAGFVIALPATIVGYILSKPEASFNPEGLHRGYSLLTWLIEKAVFPSLPEGFSIPMLHPIGFAGYIGLFVTMMNLLPVGQLDGGHIASAMFNEKQWKIGKYFLFILFLLGFFWQGWWFWGVLLMFMGFRHPVIQYDARPLGERRSKLAFLTIIIFFLTFTPIPFSIQ
jgi:membrane-associated protease RseP (regulator of RpoE activity)